MYQGGGDDGNLFLKHPTINFASNLMLMAEKFCEQFPDSYLRVAAGTRSYDKQVKFYYDDDPTPAAKPGTSNHGWGIAFDLHPGNNKATYDYTDGDAGAQTQWILENLSEYGFSNAEGRGVDEPWHHTISLDHVKKMYKL